jgi:hypothetical protein
LRWAGIELEHVFFELQGSGSQASIQLRISGNKVGEAVAANVKGSEFSYSESHIEIYYSRFKNLGFGRLLYLSLANELEKSGRVLISTANTSEDA